MPIDKRKSKDEIIKELLDKYKNTGKIGNVTPRDMNHAQEIASGIAYSSKKESFDNIVALCNSIEVPQEIDEKRKKKKHKKRKPRKGIMGFPYLGHYGSHDDYDDDAGDGDGGDGGGE